MRLISYGETPTVMCLEYSEQRDLMAHPEKTKEYEKLIEKRQNRKKKKRIKIVVEK